MTGRIIPLPFDEHRDAQSLLPWYVSGTLKDSDRNRLQAHLNQCADCRAELSLETRLSHRIAETPADGDALDVEHGLRLITESLDSHGDRSPLAGGFGGLALRLRETLRQRPQRAAAAWLGWALAGQFCLLVALGISLWRSEHPARYHALGALSASDVANIVLIFKPDTPERDFRAILRASGARLVGGPTVSDAYLLHVSPAARAAVLARLRQETEVVLAEPVDGG